MVLLWTLGFYYADLINWHMPLYDAPFILLGLECHQLNVLFQLCACHTPTSINNRPRMRLWPAICTRRQCERDKTTSSSRGTQKGGELSELRLQDTQNQTVCQLAGQKVLHIKGTQLRLPHLFVTFSLILRSFCPISFSLWEKRKYTTALHSSLLVFCFNFTWQHRKLFRFLLLKCVKPLRPAFQNVGLLWVCGCICAIVLQDTWLSWTVEWACYCFCHQFIVQFVFFASRLPFSAVCLPGNLVHWTFVCQLGLATAWNGVGAFWPIFCPLDLALFDFDVRPLVIRWMANNCLRVFQKHVWVGPTNILIYKHSSEFQLSWCRFWLI